MDSQLRRNMLEYYDECAAEYENAYTVGADTGSPLAPSVFIAEARVLTGVVQRFASGRLIDVACGTGYWFPFYQSACSRITLFDQSEQMLTACAAKVETYGAGPRCDLEQGDLLDYDFPEGTYDRALVAFFLSHLTETHEGFLFDMLRRTLLPSGRFLIMDSAFSEERATVNEKVERQQRRLNDGRAFEVFKRYCDRDDFARWERDHHVDISVEYFGTGFYAVSGSFTTP